jgi:hypothetical protein
MARKTKKRRTRKIWTKEDLRAFKQCSRDKVPVKRIARMLKRSEGSLRQKASHMGIPLGHRT